MARILRGAAAAFALAGGVLLAAVVVLTCGSVVGRWVAATPIPGDIELTQLGTAAALALFLPYCQLHGSHLIVELFTARAPASVRHGLDVAARWIAALVLGVLALRAGAGVAALYSAGESSMVLGVPLWLAYLVTVPSLALAALVALTVARNPMLPTLK
jgi:TRAP-type C4-dicarboxylate transport system permease small subunit